MANDDRAPADAFIQWKGTDVCMDFHCYKCDAFGHFDGDFCYSLQCPRCGQIYVMPSVVPLKAIDAESEWSKEPKMLPAHDIDSAKACGWAPMGSREVRFVGER